MSSPVGANCHRKGTTELLRGGKKLGKGVGLLQKCQNDAVDCRIECLNGYANGEIDPKGGVLGADVLPHGVSVDACGADDEGDDQRQGEFGLP